MPAGWPGTQGSAMNRVSTEPSAMRRVSWLLPVVAVLAVAVVVGSTLAHLLVLQRSMQTAGNAKVDAIGAAVMADIEQESMRARAIAEMIAYDPVTIEMVTAGDREALLARYVSRFQRLSATQSVGQIQFHLPGAVSLLRLHDPSRFGDDLAPFRSTIVAAQTSFEPQFGVERGVAGLLARAVVPMGDRGAIVGSVEAAVALDQAFLYRLPNGLAAEIHVIIDERVPSPTQPTTDQRTVTFADGTVAEVAKVASTMNGANLARQVDLAEVVAQGRQFVDTTVDGVAWRAGVWPIIDVTGEMAGFLLVAADVDEFVGIVTLGRWQAAATISVVLVALGIALVLAQRHRRRLAEYRSMLEFEGRLNRALQHARGEADVSAVVAHAMETAVPDVPFRFLLADADTGQTRIMAEADMPELPTGPPSPLECMAMVTGETQRFDRADVIDSCRYLRQDGYSQPECAHLGARCQPVMIEGTPVGVLHVRRPADAHGVDDRVRLLSRRAGERIASLRSHAQTQLMASTDSLTGLGTRRTTETHVAQLLLGRQQYAVLIADVDHLTDLNATYGHAAGDRALQALTRVIGDCVRSVDVIGRWGGEEFVVVMPDADEVAAVMVAERVREQLAERLGGMDAPWFTVSIGVSVSDWVEEPYSALGFDRVLQAAMVSLEAAKAAGRNQVAVSSDLPDDADGVPHPEVLGRVDELT